MNNIEYRRQADITSEFYLSRYEIVLYSILKDENVLLSEGIFGKPLYEVLLIGLVSSMESYLHDRLEAIVMKNDETKKSYVSTYNRCNRNNKGVDPLEEGASEEKLVPTFSCHTYHNTRVLKSYFRPYNLDIMILDEFEKCGLSEIIKKRNTLSHNPPRGFIGWQTVEITLAELRSAFSAVRRFLSNVEYGCLVKGYERLFIPPDEE